MSIKLALGCVNEAALAAYQLVMSFRETREAMKRTLVLAPLGGEGGPAKRNRACAHRRSLTLQSFSDGAAPARRRVRRFRRDFQDRAWLKCRALIKKKTCRTNAKRLLMLSG